YFFEGGAAQSNLVVHDHVVADDRGLADDVAHAMVDEEPPADDRAGMDLHARGKAGKLGNVAGYELPEASRRQIGDPETMGDPVGQDGMQSRIGDGLHEAAGRRVVAENRLNVFAKPGKQVSCSRVEFKRSIEAYYRLENGAVPER